MERGRPPAGGRPDRGASARNSGMRRGFAGSSAIRRRCGQASGPTKYCVLTMTHNFIGGCFSPYGARINKCAMLNRFATIAKSARGGADGNSSAPCRSGEGVRDACRTGSRYVFWNTVRRKACCRKNWRFYQSYDWCLNPYLTVGEAILHLGEELDKLSIVPDGWQIGEVATNIFLLSGGLLNCIRRVSARDHPAASESRGGDRCRPCSCSVRGNNLG